MLIPLLKVRQPNPQPNTGGFFLIDLLAAIQLRLSSTTACEDMLIGQARELALFLPDLHGFFAKQ